MEYFRKNKFLEELKEFIENKKNISNKTFVLSITK